MICISRGSIQAPRIVNTNNNEPEPPCTEANQGQWAKRNWQPQTEPLTGGDWGHFPGDYRSRVNYWENFTTRIKGWTYDAWQCQAWNAILPDDDISGYEYLWQRVTTVWSPFPSDFIPAGRQNFYFIYPSEQQLNELGTCSPEDYFTYSYLDVEYRAEWGSASVWYHATIWCPDEGNRLRIPSWGYSYPDYNYPKDYALRG